MLTYTKNVFIPLQVEGGFEFHFCCWTTTKIKALVHTVWCHRCHTIRIYLKTHPTPRDTTLLCSSGWPQTPSASSAMVRGQHDPGWQIFFVCAIFSTKYLKLISARHWCMSLSQVFGRQRQEVHCKFSYPCPCNKSLS